jgi:segregation and condensation protein A
MELAADYLVMAALLIEIKSKLLLPSQLLQEDESEEDPRMELVRRLQTYEYFKQLALLMDQLPRFEREVFQVKIKMGDIIETKIYPQVALSSIVLAMERLLQHQQCINPHQVTREPLSVRERMDLILGYFEHHSLIEFTRLLIPEEGRMGLVVTLLAILELARQSLVIITQTEPFSVIHLQANPHG